MPVNTTHLLIKKIFLIYLFDIIIKKVLIACFKTIDETRQKRKNKKNQIITNKQTHLNVITAAQQKHK